MTGGISEITHLPSPAELHVAWMEEYPRNYSPGALPVLLLLVASDCQDYIRSRVDLMEKSHRKRRQFKQTDAFTRGMVIGLNRAERSNPAAIVERPTVRQRGIMVWGAIAYDSRSPLLRIQGTMTAQRYVDDVLRPVTLPYLQGVPNALYQQDNARPHTARISQQALQDVQMLPWPPYSPDLSPIEHIWDIIGRRLHALP
ncbi:hypothetical protein LAZ67_1006323 [Cordylochernes scorpioides]|uniref:Tc1-like transposase DDE domain-containing protein n=1 Tax=Cordylochernes scorpioides TaxID=51811 RepID=A0ABY6JZR5_9ARAC|nr:hypothetical protein LAZ67_1006323 [Cordylochernes scorpioides]